MENRHCLECGKPVYGRVDKKFCADSCRNSYNNKANAASTNYMRNVNNTLAKNRRILAELNANKKREVHRDQLLRKGFDFDLYTQTYTTQENEIHRFCYEQGYMLLDDGLVFLIKRKDDN
ncbi:MAG: DUF2116 family Zn-ribbon domain-containing protein [Ekhidna sp.]